MLVQERTKTATLYGGLLIRGSVTQPCITNLGLRLPFLHQKVASRFGKNGRPRKKAYAGKMRVETDFFCASVGSASLPSRSR